MRRQAWEIFFSTFAYSNYLYRPFFASAPFCRDHEQFDRLSARLDDAIGKFAFKALRNVLINTVLKRVHPQTLQESEVAIPRVVAEGFDNDPKKADIEKFPNEKVRDLLERNRALRSEIYETRSYTTARIDRAWRRSKNAAGK